LCTVTLIFWTATLLQHRLGLPRLFDSRLATMSILLQERFWISVQSECPDVPEVVLVVLVAAEFRPLLRGEKVELGDSLVPF